MPAPLLSREELLYRLYETFSRYGYEGASMTRIAAYTGLGKASLYHHFPRGKEEMAAAVLDHVRAWYEDAVFRVLEDVTPPRQRLATMLDAFGRHYDGGNVACLPALLSLTEERDMFGEAIRELFTRWIACLTHALCDAGLGSEIAHRRAQEGAARIQGALMLVRAMVDARIFTQMAAELPEQLLAGADRSSLWTPRIPRFPPAPSVPSGNPAARLRAVSASG